MSKGRRKLSVRHDSEAAAAAAPTKVSARPRTRRRWPVVASVLAIVAGFAAWKLWPRPIIVEAPADIERAAPEVRAHILARVAHVQEAKKDPVRQADFGLALAANGFWGEARQAFGNGARLEPSNPLPAYYAARAALETGRQEDARQELADVVGRFPEFGPARYALGTLLLESGARGEATEHFRKLVQIEGEASVWGRLGLAKALLEEGKPAEAVTLLELVLARAPTLPPANYLIGSAYRAQKRLDLANRHLAAGISADMVPMPDPWTARLMAEARSVKARITFAQSLHGEGRTRQGLAVLEELRPSHPADLELLSNLGALYLAAGDTEKSREVLVHAATVSPTHVPTLYNLTATELRLGALDAALKHASRALELAPSHFHSHLSYSEVLSAMKRPEEALAAARKAAVIDPHAAGPRVRSGMLLLRLQRPAEARTELEAATRIDPSNAEAWMLLCDAAIGLKLASDARAALEQAAKLAPNAPQVQALAQRVNALGGR